MDIGRIPTFRYIQWKSANSSNKGMFAFCLWRYFQNRTGSRNTREIRKNERFRERKSKVEIKVRDLLMSKFRRNRIDGLREGQAEVELKVFGGE